MSRSTKDAWLSPEAGDLIEAEVSDVPVKGQSVKIRALSATAANTATSEAVETFEHRGQQRMRVDSVKLDIQRFTEGVIEPRFSVEEVRVISAKFGPAFNRVVSEISRISGLDRDAVAETDARFQSGGTGSSGPNGDEPAGGDVGSPEPARAGA